MPAKALMLAIIAACSVGSEAVYPAASETPTEQPDKLPPTPPEEDGQHFCCESLDSGDGKSGNDCIMIGREHTAQCDKILYCGGSWKKDGGKVTCLD